MTGLRSWLVILFVSIGLIPAQYVFFGLEAALSEAYEQVPWPLVLLQWLLTFAASLLILGLIFPPVVRLVFSVDVVPRRKKRR